MYKYILWDIDGTILDFDAAERCAIRALFEKYNFGDCSDEMIETYAKINKKYWEALERNEMTKPEILVGRFKEFFTLMHLDTSLAPAFNKDYQLSLGDYIVFVKDSKEILEKQKESYMVVGVTNGTKVAQTKKLKESGLDKIFDYVFISEDVGIEKPNIGYFDVVFDTIGLKDKSQAIIIGDSLSSDMQGGINAGIDTCWFNPKGLINTKLDLTYEIHELKELDNIIK